MNYVISLIVWYSFPVEFMEHLIYKVKVYIYITQKQKKIRKIESTT